MKRYVLVKSDEDGNPMSWIQAGDLDDIVQLMEDYGIKRFMDDVPNDTDPNYWARGDALLLEVRVLRVRPKEVVTAWTVE
jgi:hypothetical protein